MNETLSRLAAKHGIEDFYLSATGEHRCVSDEVKQGILDAMGVSETAPPDTRDEASILTTPGDAAVPITPCFVPHWLNGNRVWGLTTQLYELQSDRNHGIGDFEDLARLAELAAAQGADFIGVNPLHALFWEDPDRCSPYFPSTRQFLNPLYIAIDVVTGGELALRSLDPSPLKQARHSKTVDYRSVSRSKSMLLRQIFDETKSLTAAHPSFLQFCQEGGDQLEQFARFETLSTLMKNAGEMPGWPNWPRQLQDSRSKAVSSLLADEQPTILWHKWMQWLAHQQLADAQRRAVAAGMRIGLYLDVAVGVAPDGAATWADPDLVTAKARIGCPPDAFNSAGQDWGLAPIIPSALQQRQIGPFEDVVKATMKFAGAIRIDHVMALEHLYWIPEGRDAKQGGYVRYPREAMLDVLGRVSHANRTIVIGEDLGTVPHDFRHRMLQSCIHSYRVFYFEREDDGSFTDASGYPEIALACVGTHDLPTLRGWWAATDIETRLKLGLISESEAQAEKADRRRGREQLLSALARRRGSVAQSEPTSDELSERIIVDLHAYVASSPSRLFAVQLDDLVGATEQINLPGTHTEYPNWRSKLPVTLDEIFELPLAVQTISAIAAARPRVS